MRVRLIQKTITVIMAILFAVTVFCPFAAAVPYDYSVPAEIANISAKYVVLYEAATGSVLYEKHGDERAYPASTTKILTAIIAIESCNLSDKVTIGNIVEGSGSTMGLKPGEEFTLEQLLYGMLLVSGNDAARAIAEHVSGSKAAFAQLMNQKAAELELASANFENPNGLDSSNHYCTAHDMAKIAAYAMKNETFRKIVSTETYIIPPTNKNSEGYLLENSNRLIHTKDDDDASYKYAYATGIKTGDTSWAGRCLVASAEKDGMELIVVLFGDYEDSRIGYPRYTNAAMLFDFGFSNFVKFPASDMTFEKVINVEVSGATVETTALSVGTEDSVLCVHSSAVETIKQRSATFGIVPKYDDKYTDSTGKLKAPIKKGEIVGTVDYTYNNEVMFTAVLTASDSVLAPDENTTPGTPAGEEQEKPQADNSWLAWLLAACIIITLVILIVILLTRRPLQLKRKYRSRRMRFRR